jgi:putative transposase
MLNKKPVVDAAGGDHAMRKNIAIEDEVSLLGADWFDPLEAGVREQIRGFIESMLEEKLAVTLRRGRYRCY